MRWIKSSYSGGHGGECVQVRSPCEGVAEIGDTKNPLGPALVYAKAEWGAFKLGAQAGELRGANPQGASVS